MKMDPHAFNRPPSLRVSMKRGYARQAIDKADRSAPDLPGLFRTLNGLRPNAKALRRMAARIKGQPGVAWVALAPGNRGITLVARTVREVEVQVDGETRFRETGLIYLRVWAGLSGDQIGYRLGAVSFCQHALERLVERADLPLAGDLLPHVDAEAKAFFRGLQHGRMFEDADDAYLPAVALGVWAGGCDGMAMEDDWGLVTVGAASIPIFSVRTFLSEAEMRPTVWLRWKDDPSCRMA